MPVLTGIELTSSSIYLLEPSAGRDEPAWWAALTVKRERQGLDLALSISDAAHGFRAAVEAAFPDIELRGDVPHAQMEAASRMIYLENCAYVHLGHLEDETKDGTRQRSR